MTGFSLPLAHCGKYSFHSPKHTLVTLGLQETIKPKWIILDCQMAWTQHQLDGGSPWPEEGTFDFNVLHDLDNVFQCKWSEIPTC